MNNYIAFVHPSVERDLRLLNAQIQGSPIGTNKRRAGARGRKLALMASWHPRAWVRK
jgi:hypothetical protein